MEAIILAGGLGTRLRSVVNDQPKALAKVGEHPFLYFLINYLSQQGVKRFIFSLGYLHNQIEDFLNEFFVDVDYTVIIEEEPQGTGGAIKLCLAQASADEVLLVNADTFFDMDLAVQLAYFKSKEADCVIALTELENFDRYGVVKLDSDNRILEFVEKKYTPSGLINTGLILLQRDKFTQLLNDFKGPFSLEKDVLEPNIKSLKIFGLPQDGFFIDIGIPEDYYKAQSHIDFFQNIILQ